MPQHTFIMLEVDSKLSNLWPGLGTIGEGGRMAVNCSNPLKRVPVSKPPFTLSQLKKEIPPHCFERSIIRSFYYLVQDLTIAYILYNIANTYIHQQQLSHPALFYLAWLVCWALQGCIFTGVWFLSHECSHHDFSDYPWLNDTVGFIIHSFLLTPYFSWKYSHRRHHSNSGSLKLDELYVPKRKNSIKSFSKYLNNTLGQVITVTITLTLGFPMYFAFNLNGRPYGRFASRFDPSSPILSDSERLHIFISDAGILAVVYGLYRLVAAKGLTYMFCIYGGPLLVTNGFVVMITLLHHTHLSLPHYSGSEWDWFRGALATVDRDYGILNKVFHHISDTHAAHHLFPTLPQYHAVEATKAIKPILGEYYQFDGTPFYKAMWRQAKECLYVEPDDDDQNKGVFWYTNKI